MHYQAIKDLANLVYGPNQWLIWLMTNEMWQEVLNKKLKEAD